MRKQCCFSAATEQSTACTKPHTINTPTNTQLYKQTVFSLPVLNQSAILAISSCIFWLLFHILVIFQSFFHLQSLWDTQSNRTENKFYAQSFKQLQYTTTVHIQRISISMTKEVIHIQRMVSIGYLNTQLQWWAEVFLSSVTSSFTVWRQSKGTATVLDT